MSLHKAMRGLAESLQQKGLGLDQPGYKDGLYDAADLIIEILERYPLETGHEWEPATVFLNETSLGEIRELCVLCGMDRIWGNEASICDSQRPVGNTTKSVAD